MSAPCRRTRQGRRGELPAALALERFQIAGTPHDEQLEFVRGLLVSTVDPIAADDVEGEESLRAAEVDDVDPELGDILEALLEIHQRRKLERPVGQYREVEIGRRCRRAIRARSENVQRNHSGGGPRDRDDAGSRAI
jgi:hypothetical protein